VSRLPASGQVLDFIRTLAVAWKNLSAYPPGHPALAGAVESAHRALNDLRGPAGEVILGIASDGIVYGEDKIDTTQAQKFAQSLYGRGVAVVRFAGGTSVDEIEKFLSLLSGNPDDGDRQLWEELTALGVVNINLKPVDYSGVQLTEEVVETKPKEPTSLWDDILKALVEGRELTPKARQLLSRDVRSVDELSAMILRYIETADEPDTAEFDPDATFGIRLHARLPGENDSADAMVARVAQAVSVHIGSSAGLRRQLAVQQVIQLLRTLPDPLRGAIIRAVLRPLATDESAGSLLREVSASLDHDEVIESLRYLSTVGKLSTHAVTLIESLVSLENAAAASPQAGASVMSELVELFGEDDIDRYNPPDHQSLLKDVSIQFPKLNTTVERKMATLGSRVDTVAPESVDRQLSDSIIELIAKHGSSRDARGLLSRAENVLRSQIAGGHFSDAVETVERLRDVSIHTANIDLRDAIGDSISNVVSPETIATLIESLSIDSPEKSAAIQRLVEALGSAAIRNLIMVLTEETNRSRRRRLLSLITSLGERVVPEAIPLLKDERWYVVRNMLLLLRSVNDRTSIGEIRRLAQHPDLRVRMEAIKTLFAFDSTFPQALLDAAINDRDPKFAETAIALAVSYGIRQAIGPLLRVLSGSDVFGSRKTARLRAIKALGDLGDPEVLPQMEKFFSNSILPWPSREERRAAYESLSGYPAEARATIVDRGMRSRDAQIRDICTRLSET
jgi:HEAT repeat protein/PBS lyase HEAT-like repeat-containing protein